MNEDLLLKYINNELSDSEKKDVDKWLSESEENKILFNNTKRLWEISSEPELEDIPDIELQWSRLQPQLTEEKNIYSLYKWIGIAASFLIAITFYFMNETSSSFKELYVERAETQTVELTDHSFIQINSESTVKYFKSNDDSVRKVYLNGEAYFEVSKIGKPFIVETPNAEIRVLGTKFNIRFRNNETKVYVAEGKVSVRSLEKRKHEVVLTKGFSTEVKKKSIPTQALFKEHKIAWLESKIVFDHVSITEIFEELERLYDVEIDIRGKADPKTTLTATFERKFNVKNILQSICKTLNLKLGKQDDVYVVFK